MGKLLLLLLPFVIISSAENGGAEVQQLIELARKAGDDFAKSGTNDVGILEAGLKDQTVSFCLGSRADYYITAFKIIPPYLTYSWQYREKGLLGSVMGLFSVEMFSGTKQKSLSGDYSGKFLSRAFSDYFLFSVGPGSLHDDKRLQC